MACKKKLAVLLSFILNISFSFAQTKELISFSARTGRFPIANNGKAIAFYTDADEFAGVKRAFEDLRDDVGRVSGAKPPGSISPAGNKLLVIAGTIGRSPVIDALIRKGKLNVAGIKGTWENHVIETIKDPMPGVGQALVIAGSDKRGTIYGIYTLSEKIGVSPWYWWADVPPARHKNIFVNPGRFTSGPPAVKYRGIFLNDEAPALSGWAASKFGAFNHHFYEKVFELILRLKGNYLWPAMWGNAFNDDDPLNRPTADMYGIVMGTSHHEPMDRAQQEWKRYGKGEWDYNKNAEVLREFWRKGIENMGSAETVVSIGMRGDGDMAMEQGTNIALLEKIVADQRKIIADVTGKSPEQVPQMWALYKEVQEYYDKGMRVPDDVTLLLCDDNWGNIRKLPSAGSAPRKGGYGIYYHFDYVGGPRNYKWINTNPISKVWEQMHLAYQYNARQIWLVNVGDLKPMEFPISFFLDYAWDPGRIPAEKLKQYTIDWSAKQFGKAHATEIAEILSLYSKYNGRRKPELLDHNTYSLIHNLEFETVVNDYLQLEKQALAIGEKLDRAYRDAYYELVLHPVQASANLNAMYLAVARNQLYSKQSRASANKEAEKAKELFGRDARISKFYNDTLAGGKWKHMMDQTHIGYTYWQQPPADKLPGLQMINPLTDPETGIAIEGSTGVWPSEKQAILPEFNRYSNRKHYIELFNKGRSEFSYTITSSKPWVIVSAPSGKVSDQTRIWVSIDWSRSPAADQMLPLTITSNGKALSEVLVKIKNYGPGIKGFIPEDDVIAIEADHFSSAKPSVTASWKIIPDYGRTGSAVSPFPVTARPTAPGTSDSPVLEYNINTNNLDSVKILACLAPSLDFMNTGGLRYGISIDDEKPQIVNINANKTEALWNRNVAENINVQSTVHQLKSHGPHTLRIWMADPGIVLQKLIIAPAGYTEPSYLGPRQSAYVK